MSEASRAAANKPSSYAVGLSWGLIAGALFVLVVMLLAGRSQSGPLASLWSAITGRNTRIVSQGTVVERIQRLQRMETVVYNMDKIVTGEKGSPFLPNFLAGDRMLMIVHGQVVAGIDFAQLRPGDIRIEGRDIRVKIPQPRILVTRLDNARTRVYSRSTGLLVPVDPNLESEVRQQAEGELLDEAGRTGILKTAGDNARTTLTTLLLGMGFEKVEIE
ncbi:MAG TPA: DUF4230 domain-containing protein [Candidatus Limnocylindrales bacterium]|jgi:hypothetical protein|nr:DUF4230 domain-containing protein [Candidatus Limnocylindrales bacterium]